jgi:hypothetical protein
MKICKSCNSLNSDDMNYCTECGAFLTSDEPFSFGPQTIGPKTVSPQREPESKINDPITYIPTPVNTTAKKSKSNKLIISLAVLFLLILLAGSLVSYFAVKKILLNNNLNSQTNVKNVTPQKTKESNTTAKNLANISSSDSKDSSNSKTSNSPPDSEKAPVTSFTPPLEPTKVGTFTVYANRGWQLSNIDVVGNEKYTTIVQGLIDLAGIKNGVTHAGIKDERTKSRRIYPEYPTGALIMRTRYADGSVSNMQPTLTSPAYWQNYPNETGKLEFCINDNSPENNGGSFTITVKMIYSPKSSSPTSKPRKTSTKGTGSDRYSAGDIP